MDKRDGERRGGGEANKQANRQTNNQTINGCQVAREGRKHFNLNLANSITIIRVRPSAGIGTGRAASESPPIDSDAVGGSK